MKTNLNRILYGILAVLMCAFLWSPAAYAVESSSGVTVPLPGVSQKTIGSSAGQSFSFALTAENGAPMPTGSDNGKKTVSVTDETVVTFGEVTYSAEGKYAYQVRQIAGTNAKYTYDTTVYTISVIVWKGEDSLLHTAVWVTRLGVEGKQNAIAFENRYTSSGGSLDSSQKPSADYPQKPAAEKPSSPLTGDDFNGILWLTLFLISGVGICYFGYRIKKGQEKKNPLQK